MKNEIKKDRYGFMLKNQQYLMCYCYAQTGTGIFKLYSSDEKYQQDNWKVYIMADEVSYIEDFQAR